ncbi:Hsp70 nucleotide exchange factor FES1 [Scheffersomyces xylosifermentans]|uniref:Hsp70 nucleotide exchange factor FES1 n=1 Tax=Scheffersomyces xylosifermentans TaxID=1304137 RepID=UPI00315CF3E1
MDKLLQWSIAQQSGDKDAIKKIGQPDPKMLDQLFGGPDEPTLMKQAILVVEHPEATLENKEIALDNFEMLIENLDNANNIQNMKLWPSIIKQLDSDIPESLRVLAASIIGTAVQNNPNSQEAFNKTNGVQQLVKIASDPKSSKELLSKSLYALSSFLRNNASGYANFEESDGWKIISLSQEVGHKIQMRQLSVVSAILSTGLNPTKQENIHKAKLITYLVTILKKDGHVGCIEKSLNIISALATEKFEFSSTEIAQLSQGLEEIDSLKEQLPEEDLLAAKKAFK